MKAMTHLPRLLLLFAFIINASATELTSPDPRAGGQFGASSGALPDLTGDGIGEFYVFGSNRSYVYDGTTLEVLHTFQEGPCGVGNPTYSPGDLNGDGTPDLMLNKRCGPGLVGSVDAVSGVTGEWLFTLDSPDPVTQGFFGETIRALPDMTGDAKGDWLIRQRENQSRIGRVYIFDSQTRESVRTIQNLESAYRFWMQFVEVIPDVDSDGMPELIVSSVEASVRRDNQTFANAGRAIVRSLRTGEVLYELLDPEPQAEGAFGLGIGGVGDLTGDGIGDIGVSAFKANAQGALYFFDGHNGKYLRTLRSPIPTAGAFFGRSFSTMPDLNGDEVPELLTQERTPAVAYIYDGLSSRLLHTIAYPGDNGTRITFATTPLLQQSAPGIRGYLFTAPLAGDSQAGRVDYVRFSSIPMPPRLTAVSNSPGGFRLRITAEPGQFQIQATADWKSWQPLSVITVTNSDPVEVPNLTPEHPHRFFRAVPD